MTCTTSPYLCKRLSKPLKDNQIQHQKFWLYEKITTNVNVYSANINLAKTLNIYDKNMKWNEILTLRQNDVQFAIYTFGQVQPTQNREIIKLGATNSCILH